MNATCSVCNFVFYIFVTREHSDEIARPFVCEGCSAERDARADDTANEPMAECAR